jgi:hypothetical protein
VGNGPEVKAAVRAVSGHGVEVSAVAAAKPERTLAHDAGPGHLVAAAESGRPDRSQNVQLQPVRGKRAGTRRQRPVRRGQPVEKKDRSARANDIPFRVGAGTN